MSSKILTRTNPLIIIIFLFLIICFFSFASESQNPPINQPYIKHKISNVYDYELDNGLQLLIKEDCKNPLVTIYALVNAGSANEGQYTGCGISHFVEHMLFKGTKRYKTGQIHKLIKSLGGEINGFTSLDYTCYYITVPKDNFDKALNLMSDILQNSSFKKNEFLKEREVILKEIYMNQDNPKRVTVRNLWKKGYFVHPYQHPVIGYEKLFLNLKREDLVKFYKDVYIPDNIIISIVGDINHDEVFQKVNHAFFGFKRKPPKIAPLYALEPEQCTKRLSIKTSKTQLGYLALGFKGVSVNSTDLYALDLLANILGQGRSSRLNVKIKDDLKTVHAIEAYNYTPRYNGLFIITATFDRDNFQNALGAILNEVEEVKEEGVLDEELKKAKNTILSNHINYLQTVEAQAEDLATSLNLTADADFTNKYLDKINQINKEDIKRVANIYLSTDKLTVSAILPEDKTSICNESIQEESNVQEVRIQKLILPNKITLILKEDHSCPIVDIQAAFKGGVRLENERNNGVCNLMSQLLLEGTTNRTKLQITKELENRGASLETFSGNNSFGVSLNLISDDLEFGINLLSDMLTNSIFENSKIEHQKQLIAASLRRQKDDIFEEGFLLLRKSFFKNHPYSFNPLGSLDSISSLKRDDIVDFYQNVAIPSNLILVIFGDINAQEAKELTEESFAKFERKGNKRIEVLLPSKNFKEDVNIISKKVDKKQALIMIGFSAPSLKDNERYGFQVLDSILSGGGSKLFYNLRDKRGLAYQVGTFSIMGFEPGCYVFYIATSKDLIEESKKGLINEINKIKKYKISQKEIDEAKRYLLGQHYINLQTNSALSFKCALDEMYNLGYDNYQKYEENIKRVTIDDVKFIIDKYLDLNNYTMVILKPEEYEKID